VLRYRFEQLREDCRVQGIAGLAVEAALVVVLVDRRIGYLRLAGGELVEDAGDDGSLGVVEL